MTPGSEVLISDTGTGGLGVRGSEWGGAQVQRVQRDMKEGLLLIQYYKDCVTEEGTECGMHKDAGRQTSALQDGHRRQGSA